MLLVNSKPEVLESHPNSPYWIVSRAHTRFIWEFLYYTL